MLRGRAPAHGVVQGGSPSRTGSVRARAPSANDRGAECSHFVRGGAVMGRALAYAPSLGLALVVAGCRFSASPADPYAGAPPSATSGGAGGQGTGGPTDTGGTGGTNGASDTGGTNGASDTGGIGGTDGATGATGGGAGTDSGAGGDTGGAGRSGGGGTGGSDAGMPPSACQPATPPAICDPVKNLGCLVPFTFCDIDPTQAVATGRCVFPWSSTPPDGGGTCFVDAMTGSSRRHRRASKGVVAKSATVTWTAKAGSVAPNPHRDRL